MGIEIVFLFAGLALAFALERAVQAWSVPQADALAMGTHLQMRPMAWHGPRGRTLIGRSVLACIPVALIVAALRFDNLEALRVSLVCTVLIACSATDLLAYRVPNLLTLPGLALSLGLSAFTGDPALVNAVAAAVLAACFLGAAAVLTRGGLGGGDVKLGALIGAGLGLPLAAYALAAGIVTGGVIIIALCAAKLVRADQALPFAPFLAGAAVVALLAA